MLLKQYIKYVMPNVKSRNQFLWCKNLRPYQRIETLTKKEQRIGFRLFLIGKIIAISMLSFKVLLNNYHVLH